MKHKNHSFTVTFIVMIIQKHNSKINKLVWLVIILPVIVSKSVQSFSVTQQRRRVRWIGIFEEDGGGGHCSSCLPGHIRAPVPVSDHVCGTGCVWVFRSLPGGMVSVTVTDLQDRNISSNGILKFFYFIPSELLPVFCIVDHACYLFICCTFI